MGVALVSSIITSLLVGAVIYFALSTQQAQLKARMDRQREYILDMEDSLNCMMDVVEQLHQELDHLASDGPQPEPKQPPKPVAAGVDNGNVAPLDNDSLPLQGHTIVVGQSGSGKSNVAMSQVIRRLRDGQQLYCIDTKNEIGPIFRRHMCRVVKPDEGMELITELLIMAEERQALFAETSDQLEKPCRDFGEYFKRTGNQLPVITLVVEELIVLMPIIGQDLLIQLLVLGRSAGIFVLAMSQYLKADILDRRGSVNFNCRVFMGKYDSIGCGILFGNMDKSEAAQVREFVGSPGKAAVDENGLIRLTNMPRVQDWHLIPYMTKEK